MRTAGLSLTLVVEMVVVASNNFGLGLSSCSSLLLLLLVLLLLLRQQIRRLLHTLLSRMSLNNHCSYPKGP